MRFRPLGWAFGAEAIGFDIASLDEGAVNQIRKAMSRYGMLVIRDAALDDSGLAAFAQRFGTLPYMGEKPGEFPGIARLANVDREGAMLPPDDEMRKHFDANRLWHIDGTYGDPGISYSFLYSVTVPRDGGETEYCDLRVAWESLPRERQRQLEQLTADHSIFHSRARVGFDMSGVNRAALPSITRKLVRLHAPSGRKALIIASHVERVDGHDAAAGQALIAELVALASAPEKVYRHAWRPRDLLIWDNRCIMHRACDFPQFEQPRDLRSCRNIDVEDDGIAARPKIMEPIG